MVIGLFDKMTLNTPINAQGSIMMEEKLREIFKPIKLNNGLIIEDKFALSSIVTNSSTKEGHVTDADLAYAERRSKSANLQITGAAYVEPFGQRFEFGFAADHDNTILGLAELAKTMKKDGAKAILQLVHSGRQSLTALRDYGLVYGPSHLELHWPIEHTVQEMSKRKIQDVVRQYGEATRRAIKAGFDGVEITGANRYLIQAFFSTVSNHRDDEYGPQNLENRSRFGLEVMEEVGRVIDEEAPEGFVLGYRVSPEESAGSEVGYVIEDLLYYIDQLLIQNKIDYLATAMWGKKSYNEIVRFGKYTGSPMNQVIYNHVDDRTKVMVTGGITNAEAAIDAMKHADMIAAATPFVADPEFAQKIKEGRSDEIDLSISAEDFEELKIPENAFKDITYLFSVGKSLPEKTRETIDQVEYNQENSLYEKYHPTLSKYEE